MKSWPGLRWAIPATPTCCPRACASANCSRASASTGLGVSIFSGKWGKTARLFRAEGLTGAVFRGPRRTARDSSLRGGASRGTGREENPGRHCAQNDAGRFVGCGARHEARLRDFALLARHEGRPRDLAGARAKRRHPEARAVPRFSRLSLSVARESVGVARAEGSRRRNGVGTQPLWICPRLHVRITSLRTLGASGRFFD